MERAISGRVASAAAVEGGGTTARAARRMRGMKLGVIGGLGDDWREGIERIRIAEDLGYEYVPVEKALA